MPHKTGDLIRSQGEGGELKKTDPQKMSSILHTCRIITNNFNTKEYSIHTGSLTVIMYHSKATCYGRRLEEVSGNYIVSVRFSRKLELLFKKKT